MFFPSARNSLTAHTILLAKLQCKVLLASTPSPPIISDIAQATSLPVVTIPEVNELLTTEYASVPFSRTLAENGTDTFTVFHTSGSTGIPKSIKLPFAVGAAFMRMVQLHTPDGFHSLYRMIQEKRIFVTVLPFHVKKVFYLVLKGEKKAKRRFDLGSLYFPRYFQRHPIRGCPHISEFIIICFSSGNGQCNKANPT